MYAPRLNLRPAPRGRRALFHVRSIVSLLMVSALLATVVSCSTGTSAGSAPATSAPTVPSGGAGQLLYTRDTSLWTLDLASGQASEIVKPPELGQILSGRWSPDGSKITYSIYEVRDRRTPVAEIYVATPTGTGTSKVLKADQAATFFQSPVWGPDGSIYYLHVATSGTQRVRQIEKMDLATGSTSMVLDEVGAFDVSPDGKWLALVRTQATAASLALVDLTTNQVTEIVPGREFEVITAPRFDPTSKTIAFSATRAARFSDAGGAPPLVDRLLGLLGVGTAQAHGAPQDVWSIPTTGGTPSQMAKLDADEPVVAWSPDGSQLAILSSEALVNYQLAGGARKPILSPGGYGTVDWKR